MGKRWIHNGKFFYAVLKKRGLSINYRISFENHILLEPHYLELHVYVYIKDEMLFYILKRFGKDIPIRKLLIKVSKWECVHNFDTHFIIYRGQESSSIPWFGCLFTCIYQHFMGLRLLEMDHHNCIWKYCCFDNVIDASVFNWVAIFPWSFSFYVILCYVYVSYTMSHV